MFYSKSITSKAHPFNPNCIAKEWRKRLYRLDLPATVLRVAGVLVDVFCKASGRCRPKILAICEATGISRSSVKRALEILRDAGLISTDKPRARGALTIVLTQPEDDHAGPISDPQELLHEGSSVNPLYARARVSDTGTFPQEDVEADDTADGAFGGPADDDDIAVAIPASPPHSPSTSGISISERDNVRVAPRTKQTGRTRFDPAEGDPEDWSRVPFAHLEPYGRLDARPEYDAARAGRIAA
ncbi:ArsR family transcriptional regulator [Rhizobium sp. 9140]|uniref:ArsR family transcriptional regulator n=1 Tax=Rhizobium sp. 9140 TaxID=1761900 RepID=UPI00079611F7|nr:ArsR family transcriptional regulator [Rhizobium sp. 9140]CZT34627.1 regulatory protein, arsR family [Rhizobium sp. 9140]